MHLPFTVKQGALLEPKELCAYAHAEFTWSESVYPAALVEEIAIGQSLGTWDEKVVPASTLVPLCARISAFEVKDGIVRVTLSFPITLWHHRLDWLLTLLFGKMSFFEGLQLSDLWFDKGCFDDDLLQGPQTQLSDLRKRFALSANAPLLMGILKPNIGMGDAQIAELVVRAGSAGVQIIKDDEIRHDSTARHCFSRAAAVANALGAQGLKTLYAVHVQVDHSQGGISHSFVKELENSGASALLLNVWTAGLGVLQTLRKLTKLPIFAHPALVGAFGVGLQNNRIHPRVSLGSLLRAGGADFTLFPSPYGKLGMEKEFCKAVSKVATNVVNWSVNPLIPVPSAGLKPEHVPLAKQDFGTDFVLNAGTAIFANENSVELNAANFVEAINSN